MMAIKGGVKNKVVLVTGASRGIGSAIAESLGGLGVKVALAARSEKALVDLSAKIDSGGGRALPIRLDVCQPQSCCHAVDETVGEFGRIDALINNAGVLGPISKIMDTDPEAWRGNLAVNLLGPMYMSRAAIAQLRKAKGRIVNISSGAATLPIPTWSAYCSAKAALNQFTAVLAEEEPDIVCVALRPGMVDTAMQTRIRDEGPGVMPAENLAFYVRSKREGTLEPPRVPARAAAWLALAAPSELSGKYIAYNDPMVRSGVSRLFPPGS